MRSAVRFAARIPASCAVASASPFGRSRKVAAVSGRISTKARATARRRSCGLAPSSTMWTPPASSTWLNDPRFAAISRGNSSAAAVQGFVEVTKLAVDPLVDVVLAQMRPDRVEAPAPLVGAHRERLVKRLRLSGDVEGVYGHRPIPKLLVDTGVLREDEHAVAGVDKRRLLRDEVHAVEDRV